MDKRKHNRESIDYWFLWPRCRHCKAHINWKLLQNEKSWSITYNFRVNLFCSRQSCKVWPNYTQLMVPTFMFVESNRFDKKIVFLINSDSCPNTKDFYMLKKSHQCILSWANSLTLPQHFCGKWLFWLHFSQTVRYAHRKKVVLIKVISNWNSIRYLKFIHMNNWKHAHTMVSLP